MTIRSTVIILALLTLTVAAACTAPDAETPMATAPPAGATIAAPPETSPAAPTPAITSTPTATPIADSACNVSAIQSSTSGDPKKIQELSGGKKFLASLDGSVSSYGVEPGFVCGPTLIWGVQHVGHFLKWTPDGRHLVFHDGRTIWKVDSEGKDLTKIVDANADLSELALRTPAGDPDRYWEIEKGQFPHSVYGHYADISPDGRFLIYSTCEFDTDELAELENWELWGERAGTTDVWPYHPVRQGWAGREGFMYDLAIVDLLDGSRRRLTHDAKFDLYPVWSPDGSKIAFVNTRYSPDNSPQIHPSGWAYSNPRAYDPVFATINADGSGFKQIDSFNEGDGVMAHLSPPVWSPDGEYLALMNGKIAGSSSVWPRSISDKEISVTRGDGTDLVRIGRSSAPPAWSPSDGRLTYSTSTTNYPEPQHFEICTVNPDGTNGKSIFRYHKNDKYGSTIKQVEWSPDGEQLLFVTYPGVHVVEADGSGDRTVYRDMESFHWPEHDVEELSGPLLAKWSPDGSLIGILIPPQYWSENGRRRLSFGKVMTVAPDGSDLKILLEVRDGRFRPANQ